MAKSWDIQPSSAPKRPAEAQAPVPKPLPPQPRRFDDIRPAVPAGKQKKPKKKRAPLRFPFSFPKRAPKRARPAVNPMREPRVPLGRKRKLKRKRLLVTLVVVLVAGMVAGDAVLWQPWFRVAEVHASGPSADQMQAFVAGELKGTRFLVVPKNSIFFLPTALLRSRILAAFPDAAAVSIRPQGLRALLVDATPRASIAWWCGETVSAAPVCYQMDAQGFIFSGIAPSDRFASSSILAIYAPLATSAESSPIGKSIATAAGLPKLLEFVKAMRALNANIVSVVVRGDEADLYTLAGTRITYVMGREQQAAALATSAFSSLNLNDGSLLYIDLRFENKVFFKKK